VPWRRLPEQSPRQATATWERSAAICASILAAFTTIKANVAEGELVLPQRTERYLSRCPAGKTLSRRFSGDLAPALLVLGAKVDIVGAQGVRRIPLQELYVEDGKAHLNLADGELVAGVHLPASPPMSAYAKVRVRAPSTIRWPE